MGQLIGEYKEYVLFCWMAVSSATDQFGHMSSSKFVNVTVRIRQRVRNWIGDKFRVPVSVEVKLSFVEPGRRWAHCPSPSKTLGISYQGTMKTSVRMLKTSGGLELLYGASFCFLRRFRWAPEGFFFCFEP